MLHSRKKYALAASLVVLTTIACGWLACEAYIRWFSKQADLTPAALKEMSLEFEFFIDPLIAQKEKNVVGTDGALYHINRLGYRGRDFDVAKPKDAVRIVFYGGSQIFDLQEIDWPHRVEKILRDAGIPKAEVINAGTPGHTAFESFENLSGEGHLFDPDYVILLSAWNDLAYFTTEKPYLRLKNHPYTRFSDPRVEYGGIWDRLLCNSSQLYVRLRSRYRIWRYTLDHEAPNARGEPSSKISGIALKQYRLNLEMFVDCARDIGAVPILMTQPRLVDRHNSEKEIARIEYQWQPLTPEALYDALDKMDQVTFAVGKEKKVPVIDASLQMTGRIDYFMDHIHFSSDGSKKMAEITARSLRGMIRPRR
jgi:hypothetical protein